MCDHPELQLTIRGNAFCPECDRVWKLKMYDGPTPDMSFEERCDFENNHTGLKVFAFVMTIVITLGLLGVLGHLAPGRNTPCWLAYQPKCDSAHR